MRTLSETKPTLPASWYYDPEHYARELDAIWYADWIFVGRTEILPRDGDYFVVELGTQSIVAVRSSDGEYRAFHNTCRHRGSTLCTGNAGRFSNGRIICPYHTWTYNLSGNLVTTPSRFDTDDFDPDNYSLYAVHIKAWRGFLFINLSESPACSLDEYLGVEAEALQNWPLEDLASVHQETYTVACNWKVFWENYSECYHCARIHPELCKVMPLYSKGVFDFADLPDWTPQFEGDTGYGSVDPGVSTWTMSGEQAFPTIPGPNAEELARGVVFSSFESSLYVVCHPDYVRSVRMLPRGPEAIELVVDWLLPSEYEIEDARQLETIVELGRLVVRQDGEICELNQRGLHSNRHTAGVLVPQEYDLWYFHERIRSKLAARHPDTD